MTCFARTFSPLTTACALLLALLCASSSHAAPRSAGGVSQVAAPALPAGEFNRLVSLHELGLRQGLTLNVTQTEQVLFFPVPMQGDGLKASLEMDYESDAAQEGARTLQILVNDRPVLTHSLGSGRKLQHVSVPLPNALFGERYLKVTLRYAGLRGDNRCTDPLRFHDFVTFTPDSGLNMTLHPSRLGRLADVMHLLPRQVMLGIPARTLDAEETAAAVAVVRLLHARGKTVRVASLDEALRQADLKAASASARPAWQTGLVSLGTIAEWRALGMSPTSNEANAGNVMLLHGPHGVGIGLTGSNLQAAVAYLGSPWLPAAPGERANLALARHATVEDGRLTFDALDIKLPENRLADFAEWTVNFSSRDFPPQRWPRTLELDLGLGADGQKLPVAINVFLNGRYLDSTQGGDGRLLRMTIALPDGAIGLDNELKVRVQRPLNNGECAYLPRNLPAQLLGSSALVFETLGTPAKDFAHFAAHGRAGLELLLPPLEPGAQAAAIHTLGVLAARLSALDTPLRTASNPSAPALPDSAFLAYGAALPDTTASPVRFDRGRIELATRQGQSLFIADDLPQAIIAQLVPSGSKHAGLWVRRADGQLPVLNAALDLERGNIAFLDNKGATLSFSSEQASLIDIRYPDHLNAWTLIKRYWLWLMGAVWIVAAIAFFYALQRMRGQRQNQTPPAP